MTKGLKKESERIKKICELLLEAEKPLRVLRLVSWDVNCRNDFLSQGAKNLPNVKYADFDCQTTPRILAEVKRNLKDARVDDWFRKLVETLETTLAMLNARGKREFFNLSSELYGSPKQVLVDEESSPLGLAKLLIETLHLSVDCDLGSPPPACHLATGVADAIRESCLKIFGDDSPEIVVVDELSANALAGASRILIRRAASFSDRDILQLIHHEAYVHVATSLNGLAQDSLKILAASHAATTRTQEGLAVFAEMINGVMDVDRLTRLSHRVMAINMAEEGANFLDVYRFFLDIIDDPIQSFENTRRVFRGGVLEGGAPFTKDCVYLDGLLRVHNFLRVAVTTGRIDTVRLLFSGKIDLEDIGVLTELSQMGLCNPPKYLPPWAKDLRFLVSYLSYSSFLNKVRLDKVKEHYIKLLK